jgi:GT2 family glycosyltransferase
MDLSVILVNWNSLGYLRECLDSIYKNTTGISFEIIIVDNNSPEGGIDSVMTRFPEVVLLKSERNIGFAGANNLGFRYARGEFVLLLNPDTQLVENSLGILLKHIRALPDAGIVGCKLLNTDRSIQVSSIKRVPSILNQALEMEFLQIRWPNCPLWKLGPLFASDTKVVAVEVIPGACMLMRRTVFNQVGMLNEEYFMYAEDLDLNFEVKQAGYRNYYVGETAIIHHGGGSSRQRASHWATIMQCQAMVRYFRKTRGPVYQRLYEASLAGVAVVRLAMLVAASLFGNWILDGDRRRNAWSKWMDVLKWAVGKRNLILHSHS